MVVQVKSCLHGTVQKIYQQIYQVDSIYQMLVYFCLNVHVESQSLVIQKHSNNYLTKRFKYKVEEREVGGEKGKQPFSNFKRNLDLVRDTMVFLLFLLLFSKSPRIYILARNWEQIRYNCYRWGEVLVPTCCSWEWTSYDIPRKRIF